MDSTLKLFSVSKIKKVNYNLMVNKIKYLIIPTRLRLILSNENLVNENHLFLTF
jgi:hypothetical protein